MSTGSVMSPEEYEALAGHPARLPEAPYREVRLTACRPGGGVQAATFRCDPEAAQRVAAWLARCAERNGWGGVVTTS